MKKNILGLLTIVLAIGLSAFTAVHENQKPTGTPYYWYNVVGTTTDGGRINDTQIDKAAAMNTLTPCNDQAVDFCLYGSTNESLSSYNFGNNPPADQRIKEN